MQYVVSIQKAVEADSPEEAVAKAKDAPSLSISANVRQTPPNLIRPNLIGAAGKAAAPALQKP